MKRRKNDCSKEEKLAHQKQINIKILKELFAIRKSIHFSGRRWIR